MESANKAKNTEAFKLIGNWDEQSVRLKKKFPQLTDADLWRLRRGKK